MHKLIRLWARADDWLWTRFFDNPSAVLFVLKLNVVIWILVVIVELINARLAGQ